MTYYLSYQRIVEQVRGWNTRIVGETASSLADAYNASRKRILDELMDLGSKIDVARAAGENISPAWLFQQERLQHLLDVVTTEIDVCYSNFGERIVWTQQEALQKGLEHGRALLGVLSKPGGTAGSFAGVPRFQVWALSRVMTEWGQFLWPRMEELFGPSLVAEARKQILTGMILGENPMKTAKRLSEAFDARFSDVVRILRTETMRAWRLGALASYAEAGVKAWMWYAHLDDRTCISCWMMHGHIWPLDMDISDSLLNDHVNGRCTILPVVDMEHPPEVEPGEKQFERLPEEKKRRILGDRMYDLVKKYEISPRSLVRVVYHPVWGYSISTATLANMRFYYEGPGAALRIPKPKDFSQEQSSRINRWLKKPYAQSSAGGLKDKVMKNLSEHLQSHPDWRALCDGFERGDENVQQFTSSLETYYGNTTSEKIISGLVHNWAVTSGGNPLAWALQEAVAEEFALPRRHIWGLGKTRRGEAEYPFLYSPTVFRGLRAFVRAQYDMTQAYLKEANITEVPLFRGMKTKRLGLFLGDRVGEGELELQPASSFSLSAWTSLGFAGTSGQLVVSIVPRERILSFFGTGWGCLNESEMVVIGGRGWARGTNARRLWRIGGTSQVTMNKIFTDIILGEPVEVW